MLLKHFGHQAVDRTAGSGDALEQVRAARLAGERPLDRLDLTAQPAHPVDQPSLVAEPPCGRTFVIRVVANGSALSEARALASMLHGSRSSRRIWYRRDRSSLIRVRI